MSRQQQEQHDDDIPQIFTLYQIYQVIQSSDSVEGDGEGESPSPSSSSSFEDTLLVAMEYGFEQLEKDQFFAAPIQTLGLQPYPFSIINIGGANNCQDRGRDGETVEAATAEAADSKQQQQQQQDDYTSQTCVKSGYFLNNKYYVIKVATGGTPLPNNWGCMQVYSQYDGKLRALLLDHGILTELRTACVGALAAKYLAPKQTQLKKIGILGCGIQARYQLDFLHKVSKDIIVPNISQVDVVIWGRNPTKVNKLIEELLQEKKKKSETTTNKTPFWNSISSVQHPNDLLLQCELIITTTSSTKPLLGVTNGVDDDNFWKQFENKIKQDGLHITCIGSDAPGKCELEPNFITKYCSLGVADTLQQSKTRGEFQYVLQDDDIIDQDHNESKKTTPKFISLGQLLLDKSTYQRRNDDDNRVTIFDSSGVALQDCIISEIAYEALLERNNKETKTTATTATGSGNKGQKTST